MLHLRLMVPSDRTAGVVDLLRDHLGVAHLAVFPGGAVKPEGDVVLADVARESADDILRQLREREIDRCGSISLDAIDTSLSELAERAEAEAPGDPADAVIWEQVVRTAYDESALSATYFAFLSIATLLAACAIVLDSAVLIVGAMVLGPEFGAIAGLAVGIVHRRRTLLRRAVKALSSGFLVAIAVTFLFALLARAVGWIDVSLSDAERPQTGFIIAPDKWSVVVAFIAGIAGVLSLTASRSGALVGVFISVTTVPAAANVALDIALGDLVEMRGALLQLGINIAAILVAGVATMLVQKALWRRVPQAAPRPAGRSTFHPR